MSTANLIIEVTGEGREVTLPANGQLVIGSDPERSDLTLDDQGIAPVHCTVGRIRGGGWALKDLGSDYGSLVNGRPATTVRLMHGDVIVLGSIHLRVKDPNLPTEPVPADPAPQGDTQPSQADAPAPPPAASLPTSGTPDLPGYRLEKLLGRGGMGRVWLATQVSLDRRVAIKVLSAGLEADGAFVDQFQAEARAAAALAHPNVVTVHDVGEAGGHHFLTMEFMGGGCLESRLAELGPVPWQEALTILRDAARGLEYAESKGIVHRDIKPANLMCTEAGLVKIADLGLAGSVEQEEVTGGGKIFGTPHFIAPEVVRGSRADARSDLYSLGATAYRIISGHTPFEGDSSKEILRQVLHEDAPDLREFEPDVPDGVNDLIARLLAKRPEERPPSAAILLREIDRLLERQGAPPVKVVPRSSSKKTPAWQVLLVVAVLALVAKLVLGNSDTPVNPEPKAPDPLSGQAPTPNPTETPTDPPGPDPGTPPTEEPGQAGDRNEQLVELAAENELLKLRDLSITDEERITKLRSLAKRFLGTDAANRAGQEADQLEARLAAETEANREVDRRRQTLLDAMKLATQPTDAADTRPAPGRALRALLAVPGQEDWSDDGEFTAARCALQHQVLREALDWAQQRLAEAQKFEEAGDFEGVKLTLADILPLTDLPPLTGDTSTGMLDTARELLALGEEARVKHGQLGNLESEYLSRRSRADRLAIAKGVGSSSSLRTMLRNLNLGGCAEHLNELHESLTSPAARATLAPIKGRVEAGQMALQGLVDAWEQGRWKRHSILDPTDGRGSLQAAGADASGLRLMIDGAPRHTPWSAWKDNPRAFENLFTSRLEQPWTATELQNISSALMLVSISHTLGYLEGFLDGDDPFGASLSKNAEADVTRSFATAMEWADRAGDEGDSGLIRASIIQEAAASKVLLAGLSAGKAGRWAEAVSALEYALEEHGESLLVLLLADGSDFAEPRAVTPSPVEENEDADTDSVIDGDSGNPTRVDEDEDSDKESD